MTTKLRFLAATVILGLLHLIVDSHLISSFFVAVVLAAHFAGRHGALTLWGAQLYFWGRVGYVLAAAAGLGLVRSVLFFNAALSGIVLFLIAFLR